MRLLLSLSLILVFLLSCQQAPQRYTEQSPQIDTVKNLLSAYEEGNYDYYLQVYAEDAEIYHNSTEAMTVADMIAEEKEGANTFSSMGFEDDVEYEFVTTDSGEQWVNAWGIWKGTLAATKQEFTAPVHLSLRFADGKVVEEWGYWDNTPIAMALMELASKEEANEVEGEVEAE